MTKQLSDGTYLDRAPCCKGGCPSIIQYLTPLVSSKLVICCHVTFHGKYSHVADIVQLSQDFREVIIEGIKEIPTTRIAKLGQEEYIHEGRFLYQPIIS